MVKALILGAAVWPNEQPSPALARRTAHAAQLFHAGKVDCLICCGGIGRHGPSEAEVMARLLRASGIPPSAIRQEERSTTTWENIAFARDFLIHSEPVCLVTDSYHAPRARLIARALGLRATSDSVPIRALSKQIALRAVTREGFAVLKSLWQIINQR